MQLSLVARILWAAGFIELAALLIVLLGKGRWRMFPIFSLWIGFQVLRAVTFYPLYRHASHEVYARVYWSTAGLDLVLQIAIVFELARIVLKPTGTWVSDARRMFLLLVCVGTAIAAGASYGIALCGDAERPALCGDDPGVDPSGAGLAASRDVDLLGMGALGGGGIVCRSGSQLPGAGLAWGGAGPDPYLVVPGRYNFLDN
jgi:hypothetical protein